MKIRIKDIVVDGELFINTRIQCKRYNIKYKEEAYYETFVGMQPGYVSDQIMYHLVPFRSFIVKMIDELRDSQNPKNYPYCSVDTSSVEILSTYTPEQIKEINKMRDDNVPITEAFNFLSLTTADEQKNLARQWYSENDKITISNDASEKLTNVDYIEVTRKPLHLLLNYDLTDKQLEHVKKLISNNENGLSHYDVKKDPILPDDLDWEYVYSGDVDYKIEKFSSHNESLLKAIHQY